MDVLNFSMDDFLELCASSRIFLLLSSNTLIQCYSNLMVSLAKKTSIYIRTFKRLQFLKRFNQLSSKSHYAYEVGHAHMQCTVSRGQRQQQRESFLLRMSSDVHYNSADQAPCAQYCSSSVVPAKRAANGRLLPPVRRV